LTQCSSRQLPCSLLKSDGTVFIENQLLHVPHPSCSPDLAPSDFWLFGRIKTGLTGRSFAEPEELLEGVREFLEGIPAAELTAAPEDWIDRVRWVITHNKQYQTSQMLCTQFRFPIVRPWLCRKNILIPLYRAQILGRLSRYGLRVFAL
jgi:hypothetical protein